MGVPAVLLLLVLSIAVADLRRLPTIPDFFPENPNTTKAKTISFTKYNRFDQMYGYLNDLAHRYPTLVEIETIGNSVENRPIQVLRITNNTSGRKPAILIDAGIHAREWIAPAVALYIINELVENYAKNKYLVDRVEWHVVPLLNPDGYVYSMEKDRMWRKNRAQTTDPYCSGVDLNRNFDVYFGGPGTSGDPCEETYTGPMPFSEPETRALRDYALKYKNRFTVYLTLHSYGKYILYPWGFGDVLPRDWKELDRLARYAEKALSALYGTHYEIGSSTRLLGAAAGGSDDWMKAAGHIKYSYTVELPGGGQKGFDLPPSNIPYVTREMFEAIKLIGRFVSQQQNSRR